MSADKFNEMFNVISKSIEINAEKMVRDVTAIFAAVAKRLGGRAAETTKAKREQIEDAEVGAVSTVRRVRAG